MKRGEKVLFPDSQIPPLSPFQENSCGDEEEVSNGALQTFPRHPDTPITLAGIFHHS